VNRTATEAANILVGDVEELADFLGCLALDHVGDSLAAHVPVKSD
jgi:hypothetical protein